MFLKSTVMVKKMFKAFKIKGLEIYIYIYKKYYKHTNVLLKLL